MACQRCLTTAALQPQPCLFDHLILYPQPMRWHSEVAAGLLFHAVVANGFSRCLGRLPRSRADGTGTASRRRPTEMMSAPLPGLFGRKSPLGLGSWRVESVVDSQEPNSMFVFLFDDGSGEGMRGSPRPADRNSSSSRTSMFCILCDSFPTAGSVCSYILQQSAESIPVSSHIMGDVQRTYRRTLVPGMM